MIAGASFLQNAFTLQLHFPQSPTKRNRSPKALSSSSSSYIPFLNHQCHHSHSLLPFRHLSPFLRFSKSPSFSKVIRGVMLEPESEDSDFLPVELCYTHTLPPALTLEHGLLGIKQEIEKLKSNPPSSKSGLLRFQVSVPQSTKALGLLCSQSQLDGLCPQFYLSKQNLEKPILDLHAFSDVHGISGVGAAVHFVGSSRTFTKWSLIKRYLSVDSPLIRAYGLLDIDFDLKSSSLKRQTGSFYFFIPQIELDEYDGVTLLAAMFAWNCSSTFNFEKAVHSFELSFHQVLRGFSFPKDICCNISINTAGMKSDMMEETNVKMLLIDAHSFTRNNKGADNLQVEVDSSFNQFFFKFSPTIALANDMLDNPSETRCLLKNSANINAVWASLIIEECSRLGLQYIFIAPGSRSSPLAIAAVTHPWTRCISCYDERSLAFHAVGYARGSRKPAVIITSSGTAVSNLLPAVVEASQDFIPLLLLTADRPPELQDAGANQSINQVNHFSSFVRFFFNLPSPTDDIPLRMVLTTIDTAVYRATHAPDGPVHINCPFREPLGDTPSEWKTSCLKGLEFWMSSAEPFTTYIRMEHSHACDKIHGKINDVLELIRSAKMGFLLIGSLLLDDDMWAALVLAKHLSWPIVADILSGLRLRKAFSRFPEIKNEFLFLDHFDQVLFSDSVKDWAKADVVVQIGSRITSKRICQMLEVCSPHSYIMVDKHPQRFDPSHIITHRIQSTVTEFASALIEVQFPKINSKWSYFLQALNTVVEWEMSFQIHSEHSLTEPLVAQVISESLPVDAAFFFGNSMVIRDANMFGHGWVKPRTSLTRTMPSLELDCLGIQAAGNRGASGIDGLLSTAVGFAIGCNKRVFCVIGDISFLHDTNGLALMKQREWRKPMIVLVINNHGGAIFSLLPIADKIKPSILSQYFYTSHDISIGKLCKAHSVNHILVRTKVELQHALSVSQQAQSDFLIEVESSIEDNATFHSILGKYACRAADHTLKILSRLMTHVNTSSNFQPCRIHRIEYSLYRIELSAPLTTFPSNKNQSRFYREGFILALALEDGCIGFGEVAPLSIQKENVLDVEQQLRFLVHVIQGAQMSSLLPLLRGAFSSWIWSSLGIPPYSIFPSVRCGVEMAILNAVAASQGYSLSNLLVHHQCSNQRSQLTAVEQIGKSSSSIQICALLDSCGTPMEVANVAEKLVKKGFNSIKLKVGRRGNPLEDAAVVQEIRKKIGHQIKLRVDANRNWTYKQAIEFGSGVELCNLQYIEEPVQLEDDIIRFCEETGLPVALDETISDIQGDPLSRLAKFMHTGIVALVIKPSVIGGFEKAASVAKWAQKRGKMVIVSAAFESSLSLAAYVQFSYYLEQENIEICRMMNKEPNKSVAHGLGTYSWLKEDVSMEPLRVSFPPDSKVVEASVEDAARLLNGFNVNNGAIQKSYVGEEVRRYQVTLYRSGFSYSINVQELGPNTHDHVLVFFHGFLGTSEDWTSIMMAISTSVRCISIDLPGHGESKIEQNNNEGKEELNLSIEVIADLFCELICKITPAKVVLLGYSMGARVALYMALRCNKQIDGAVIVSGSPGLKDVRERRTRMVQDDARAHFLETKGLHSFLDTWYSGNLWMSLRAHPQFNKIISSRLQHKDVYFLAKSLSDLSIGKQPSLWEDLKECTTPLSFVCGEMDEKFKEIAKQMLFEVRDGSVKGDDHNHKIHEMIEVPDCGHAVHLENPLYLIKAIRKFLTRLNKSTSMRSASSSTSL